jgi:dienelactone hydrolase
MRKTSQVLAAAILLPGMALAEVQTETVTYQDGDQTLTGYLAYDDAIDGKRPGVLVVHEWWGLNDYAKRRAEMLAELGYVAFAADMYGDNRVTKHAADAKGWMQQITSNVEGWRTRAMAGLDVLRQQPQTDAERLAAIGYCFGGATVMQMAYGGADIDGVVSFHGSLPAPPADLGSIAPSVLAAHGSADGFVPTETVRAFEDGLARIGADWQLVTYGGARHGFTNPNADEYGIDNVAYDPKADQRSWLLMQGFLEEVLAD